MLAFEKGIRACERPDVARLSTSGALLFPGFPAFLGLPAFPLSPAFLFDPAVPGVDCVPCSPLVCSLWTRRLLCTSFTPERFSITSAAPAFLFARVDRSSERHFAADHRDFNFRRIDIRIIGQALAHLFANAIVRALIPARTAAAILTFAVLSLLTAVHRAAKLAGAFKPATAFAAVLGS